MGKYDEYVYTLPKIYSESDTFASPKAYFNGAESLWGSNMIFGFTVIQKEALLDFPHVHHAVEEIYMFSGHDLCNFFDFDAEIEMWIGDSPENMEKYVITKPTLVRIPARMWHGPINYKRVGKPVAFSSVYMNGERSKVTRRIHPDGTVDFPYLSSNLKRCVIDKTRKCNMCGRCTSDLAAGEKRFSAMDYAHNWAKEIAAAPEKPRTGKYDELFFEYPVEYHSYGEMYANPRGKFRGILQQPDVNFFGGFSVAKKIHNVEVPHCHHARDEYLWFSGSDLSNPFDFDAEIEIKLGWDPDHMESVIITEPSVIRVPQNMWHCPIVYKSMNKPVAFFPAYGDGDWSKIICKKDEYGENEFVFEAASLRKCVYNYDKFCMYCGACAKDDSVPKFGTFMPLKK